MKTNLFIKSIAVFSIIGLFSQQRINAQTNVFPTTGFVGVGTTTPGAELSFKNVSAGTEAVGITWHSPDPQNYGVHRTSGAWTSPAFQQLRASWKTGIILDPGSGYSKSYVDIV